jgi:hypothetical protein
VVSDAWVVDGTYPELLQDLLPDADLVIWIEQPAWLRALRAWRKTHRHRNLPRPDRPDGCTEAFSLSYLRTIVNFGRCSPQVKTWLAERSPGAALVPLKGDRAVESFLRERVDPGPVRTRPPTGDVAVSP